MKPASTKISEKGVIIERISPEEELKWCNIINPEKNDVQEFFKSKISINYQQELMNMFTGNKSLFDEQKKAELTTEEIERAKLKFADPNSKVIDIYQDDISDIQNLEAENSVLNNKVLILQDELKIMNQKWEKILENVKKSQVDMFEKLEEQQKYIEELRALLNSDKKSTSKVSGSISKSASKLKLEENSHKIDDMVAKRAKISESEEVIITSRQKSRSVYNDSNLPQKEVEKMKRLSKPGTPRAKVNSRSKKSQNSEADLKKKKEEVKTDTEAKIESKKSILKDYASDFSIDPVKNECKDSNVKSEAKKRNRKKTQCTEEWFKYLKGSKIFKIEKKQQKAFLSDDNEDYSITGKNLQITNESNEFSLMQKMDDPKSWMPENYEHKLLSETMQENDMNIDIQKNTRRKASNSGQKKSKSKERKASWDESKPKIMKLVRSSNRSAKSTSKLIRKSKDTIQQEKENISFNDLNSDLNPVIKKTTEENCKPKFNEIKERGSNNQNTIEKVV